MKKLFLLLAALITFTMSVMAQNQTVSGTVSGVDGEPLIGATVMGVGTQIGAATDIDGNFSFSLPVSVKKIKVSYVGMETREVNITPGQKMNIVLDGSTMLDEVITVAYGTAKKSSFTGAASTALYGSRAANGVIVITTKKGKEQKSRVTFDARIGVNSRGISNYDIMTDPGMYMLTNWTLLRNQSNGAEASAKLIDRVGYNPFNCADNEIVDANGNLTSASLLYNDDWTDEAITTGLRQEYNLTVQGGSDKSNHFLSIGYLDDEGIIKNSDYSRLSFRASGDYNVNRYISINGNVAYSRGEQNALNISSLSNYSNTFAFIQNIAPIYPVYAYDAQGNRVYNANGSSVYDFGDGRYGTRPIYSNQNVVASDDANQNRYIRDNVSSRFGAAINIIDGLQFRTSLGYDMTNVSRDQFMTPTFGDAQTSEGRAYKTRSRNETITVNELLSYTKKFGEKHSIDVLAGHENYNMKYSYVYGAKSHFFDAEIPEFDNAIQMDNLSSASDEYSIESWLGRVNYGYDDKYYISGSLRSDGSSRFAKDNRWGTFWSVGGSWRISKENFMENQSWIDNMSIRASYGSVGNDDIYYPGTSSSNYYPAITQYAVENQGGKYSLVRYYQGNPDITWETSYNFNVGFTAQILKNLLNIDFEYFHKRTKDMLYNVPQPPSSGVSYISENALTMINKGIEFTLGVNIPMPKDFTWNWTFTGTHYVNKVTDIPENKREDGITHGSYYNIREGRSVWDFYYYQFAGLDEEGHSTWYADQTNKDGSVSKVPVSDYSKATKYYIGTAIPDFQGGITTNLTYKGLDFSVAMNYQLGGDIYDGMYAGLMGSSTAGHNWHKDILNAWTPENKNTNVPILDGDQNANTFSDRFLIGADYFNIRNITLGYTFPKNWLSKADIENARIYVNADNVALWSKRKGMDPRQYISGESAANYSTIRTVSLGLSLTF